MARIPDTYSRRSTPDGVRPVAVAGNAGAVAAAVEGLGSDLSRATGQIQVAREQAREEAEIARASDIDARVANEITALLYDPDKGYMHSTQGGAVEGYKSFGEALQGIRNRALEGMSEGVTRRAQGPLNDRILRAQALGGNHFAAERRSWIEGSTNARLAAAGNAAVMGYGIDEDVQANLSVIRELTRAQGKIYGWSPEQQAIEEQKAVAGVMGQVILRRAKDNPVAAMEYARQNADALGPLLGELEMQLKPAVDEYIGRQVVTGGMAAVQAPQLTGSFINEFVAADNHNPDISGVNPEVLSLFGRLQGEVGRVMPLNSGARNPSRNRRAGGVDGSQHLLGNAIDIDVSDMSIAERVQVIALASQLGFKGIGVGATAIHLDLGGRRAWGYGPNNTNGRELVPEWAEMAIAAHEAGRPVQGTMDVYEQILSMESPDQQRAALRQLTLHTELEKDQRIQAEAQLEDRAFALILQGGSVDELAVQDQVALGMTVVAALRRAQKAIEGDGKVPWTQRGREEYYRLQQLAGGSSLERQEFMSANLMELAGDMPWSELQQVMGEQRRMRYSAATESPTGTSYSQIKTRLNEVAPGAWNWTGERDDRTNGAWWLMKGEFDAFAEREGRAPTNEEQLDMARRAAREYAVPHGTFGWSGVTKSVPISETAFEMKEAFENGQSYNIVTSRPDTDTSDPNVVTRAMIEEIKDQAQAAGLPRPTDLEIIESILEREGRL